MNERRGRGEGSITRLHDRTKRPWQGRIRVRGKRVTVYGETRGEVVRLIADARRQAEKGLPPTNNRLTLAAFVDLWLARDRDVRERTRERYRTLLRGHVVPVIGSRKLAELRPDDVRAVLDRMKGAGLSPTTRSHVRGALRLALRDAVRDGLLDRNVASRDYVDAPSPTKRRPPALTDAEIHAVLSAVEGDRLAPLFRFAMATGARLGEITALRWQDVHRDRDEIEFVQTVGRLTGRYVWGATKNDASARTFPMTAGVRAALEEQGRLQDSGLTGAPPKLIRDEMGVVRGPLVFTATDGGPLCGSYVTHHFQKLLAAAGLPRMRIHDVRHAFVSTLFADGVPLEEIAGLVGHSSSATTRQIYLHLLPARQRRAAASIDRFFATGS